MIINHNTNVKLKPHEEFFIEKMKFIFYDLYHNTKTEYREKINIFDKLEQLIYEDMIQEGLLNIQTSKISLINYTPPNILDILYTIITIIFLCHNTQFNMHNCLLTILVCFITFIIMLINKINILLNLKINVFKTEHGHKCTERIKAQKRFLKTYTLISDKSVKDTLIWESYIRNSILLDLKGKLDQYSIAYYKNILNKYSYTGLENLDEKHKKLDNIVTLIFIILPWILLFVARDSILKLFLTF